VDPAASAVVGLPVAPDDLPVGESAEAPALAYRAECPEDGAELAGRGADDRGEGPAQVEAHDMSLLRERRKRAHATYLLLGEPAC
jgi:hypothetical protein